MADIQDQWTEADSQLYQEIARVAVPARAGQIAALLTLLPFRPEDAFRAVEVGCGEGILSSALLRCYPRATVTALDGSAGMRAEAANRLARFDGRGAVEAFELTSTAWHAHLQEADAVLSSLCLHHLTGPAKRELFAAIQRRLSGRGTLLIADLVEPQRPEARELFAATWDQITAAQSLAETKETDLFEKFSQAEWNYYRFYDPFDKPSPLFDQLLWLKEAGFIGVDCFWLQAGHAIYGGYKAANSSASAEPSFEHALQVAQATLA